MSLNLDNLPSFDIDKLLGIKADPDAPETLRAESLDRDMELDGLMEFFNFKSEELPSFLPGVSLSHIAEVESSASGSVFVRSPEPEENVGPHVDRLRIDPNQEASGRSHETPLADLEHPFGLRSSVSQMSGAETGEERAKRRRRIRNAKQQELNRLAQQRYRERKKQKYTSLQSAVEALSDQIEKMRVLEEEKASLASRNFELQKLLDQQTARNTEQQKLVQVKDKRVREQAELIKKQQEELSAKDEELLAKSQEAERLRKTVASCQCLPKGSAKERLTVSDSLVDAVKMAILEATAASDLQHVLSSSVSDAVVQQLSQTICRRCSEMYTHMKASPTVSQAPTAIQVSCC